MLHVVRFQVLTAVLLRIQVFLDVTQCQWVDGCVGPDSVLHRVRNCSHGCAPGVSGWMGGWVPTVYCTGSETAPSNDIASCPYKNSPVCAVNWTLTQAHIYLRGRNTGRFSLFARDTFVKKSRAKQTQNSDIKLCITEGLWD